MTRTAQLITAIAILAGTATELGAQHKPARGIREVRHPSSYRDGFWASFSLGAGDESFRVRGTPGGYSEEVTGAAFSLKMGGTPGPNWTLGGELFAWAYDALDYDLALSSLMLIAQWYPSARGGFFIKGGAGVAGSFYEEQVGQGFIATDRAAGVGFVVGAGLELRVGRNISLAPTIDLHHQYFGKQDVTERILGFGVGVTFH